MATRLFAGGLFHLKPQLVQRFRQGDFPNAISFFERAATADPNLSEPFYNLSQAYSETFSFDEVEKAQQDARKKDEKRVVAWIADSRSVILVEGGIDRMPELTEKLEAAIAHGDGQSNRLAFGFVVLVGSLLAALGWSSLRHQILPGARFGQSVPSANRWLLALVPGAQSADVGAGIVAFLQVLLPIFILPKPSVATTVPP